MSHLSREKLDLVTRTKKVIGQLESVLRALNQDEQCAEVLQRLAAARGAINSLMGELLGSYPQPHAAQFKVFRGSCRRRDRDRPHVFEVKRAGYDEKVRTGFTTVPLA